VQPQTCTIVHLGQHACEWTPLDRPPIEVVPGPRLFVVAMVCRSCSLVSTSVSATSSWLSTACLCYRVRSAGQRQVSEIPETVGIRREGLADETAQRGLLSTSGQTPRGLAMQKVVGSSPIIRSQRASLDGLLLPPYRTVRPSGMSSAQCCPLDGRVERVPLMFCIAQEKAGVNRGERRVGCARSSCSFARVRRACGSGV
jgi:hypothetical protein